MRVLMFNDFRKYIAQASCLDFFIVDVEKADGIFIYDKKGKKYFDFLSGMSVNALGHQHPAINNAIQKQMLKYSHVMVYGEFIQEPQIALAKKLCSLLPEQLQQIFYVTSGTEAIEGAIKLSRLYNKRAEIISFKNSYHGATMGSMSAIGDEDFRNPFRPILPDTKILRYNNEDDLVNITEKTSCVIIEPIQSGAGMIIASVSFLKALRKRCDEVGALLIYDEIQSGYGRTGNLYAFQKSNVIPDVLCVAKSFGGGIPMGALISSPKIMKSLNNGHPLLGHATTYGGHPLSCAASLAVLNIVSERDFLEDVKRKGDLIRREFQHPEVIEIRGEGLFLAAVLKNPEKIEKIVENCMKNGFITFWMLFNKNVLELVPPLTITEDEIKQAAVIFKKSLDNI